MNFISVFNFNSPKNIYYFVTRKIIIIPSYYKKKIYLFNIICNNNIPELHIFIYTSVSIFLIRIFSSYFLSFSLNHPYLYFQASDNDNNNNNSLPLQYVFDLIAQ